MVVIAIWTSSTPQASKGPKSSAFSSPTTLSASGRRSFGASDYLTYPKTSNLPCPRTPWILQYPNSILSLTNQLATPPHSLSFKVGAGETDGEGIERNWAVTNGVAASTREMGAGARHDTIDDHCGHANWRKLVGLGANCHFFLSSFLPSSTAPLIDFGL